ncbi:MAG: GtrA family protein [Bacteroidales bacterium]|nr:GtrA family protein [Bacteroidales bacterium]
MRKPTRKRLEEVLTKFIMFMLTSSLGTVVDLGLHWFLSARFFQDSYLWTLWIAPLISFELAVLTNFIIAYQFVWRERITRRSTRSFWRHFAAYNATSAGTFLIRLLLMQGIHFVFVSLGWLQGASYEPVLCNMLATCVTGTMNFYMSEFVIFKKVNKKKE